MKSSVLLFFSVLILNCALAQKDSVIRNESLIVSINGFNQKSELHISDLPSLDKLKVIEPGTKDSVECEVLSFDFELIRGRQAFPMDNLQGSILPLECKNRISKAMVYDKFYFTKIKVKAANGKIYFAPVLTLKVVFTKEQWIENSVKRYLKYSKNESLKALPSDYSKVSWCLEKQNITYSDNYLSVVFWDIQNNKQVDIIPALVLDIEERNIYEYSPETKQVKPWYGKDIENIAIYDTRHCFR